MHMIEETEMTKKTYPLTEWSNDKRCTRIIVTKGPDDYGRCDLQIYWWQDGKPRGQCFGAVDLAYHVRAASRYGGHAEVITTVGQRASVG